MREESPDDENEPGEEGWDPPFCGYLDDVVVKVDVLPTHLGETVFRVLEDHVHRVRAGAMEGKLPDNLPARSKVFNPVFVGIAVEAENAQGAALHRLGTGEQEEGDDHRDEEESFRPVEEKDESGGNDQPDPGAPGEGQGEGNGGQGQQDPPT